MVLVIVEALTVVAIVLYINLLILISCQYGIFQKSKKKGIGYAGYIATHFLVVVIYVLAMGFALIPALEVGTSHLSEGEVATWVEPTLRVFEWGMKLAPVYYILSIGILVVTHVMREAAKHPKG